MKLKPCMHCDHEMEEKPPGDYTEIGTDEKNRLVRYVRCPNCGACGPNWVCDYMKPSEFREEAVEAWNSRIPDEEPQERTRIKAYYAHSVGLFDTEQEKRDVNLILAMGFAVHNPNNEDDAAGYGESGMGYFEKVVQACGMLVFRANPDGSINAGVAREIAFAEVKRIPVIELPCACRRRALDPEQTRAFLRESGQR